jgi:nitroreductase
MQDFLTLAHERYSCRQFSQKPIEQGKLDRVLEAAVAAPTAPFTVQPARSCTKPATGSPH